MKKSANFKLLLLGLAFAINATSIHCSESDSDSNEIDCSDLVNSLRKVIKEDFMGNYKGTNLNLGKLVHSLNQMINGQDKHGSDNESDAKHDANTPMGAVPRITQSVNGMTGAFTKSVTPAFKNVTKSFNGITDAFKQDVKPAFNGVETEIKRFNDTVGSIKRGAGKTAVKGLGLFLQATSFAAMLDGVNTSEAVVGALGLALCPDTMKVLGNNAQYAWQHFLTPYVQPFKNCTCRVLTHCNKFLKRACCCKRLKGK